VTRAYRLITDSCCDLPRALVDELGVTVLEFPFTIDDAHYFDDLGASMPHPEFYARMRAGAAPTTAQVPMTAYLEAFRSAAEAGESVLFLSFSSGLSGTHDAAVIARNTVLAEIPHADLRVIDTRAASIHQGLLVVEAARRRAAGATISALDEWVELHKGRLNGYFTLDTLESLRRGGRLSDMAAMAGTMLDVKPILRVNGEGNLVIERPVRGRKKSLRALADIFEKRAVDATECTVVVAHADAPEEAEALAALLRERRAIGELLMLDVGPVIGSHTGPGMVATVFWGPERDS
jgi:DegV family protein with EDD domain